MNILIYVCLWLLAKCLNRHNSLKIQKFKIKIEKWNFVVLLSYYISENYHLCEETKILNEMLFQQLCLQ